jgi:hypothetical protein
MKQMIKKYIPIANGHKRYIFSPFLGIIKYTIIGAIGIKIQHLVTLVSNEDYCGQKKHWLPAQWSGRGLSTKRTKTTKRLLFVCCKTSAQKKILNRI